MSLKPYAIALVLAACTPVLPPTLIPVCSGDYDVTCRAPTRAANMGQGRDMEWEAKNRCPDKEDLRCRACYVVAGAIDGRQVYRFTAFKCKPQ